VKSQEAAETWFDEIVRHGTVSEKASLPSVLIGKDVQMNGASPYSTAIF
jgi:hypothetical protein